MPYLTSVDSIKTSIELYSQAKTLWLDTEVAEPQSKKPQLSLISILDDSTDLKGESVTIIDVLGQPELIDLFIEKIMVNPEIKKVFHNAAFDKKFLGGNKAENVHCTMRMAQSIPYYLAPLPNYKLATLAQELCYFPSVDKSLQSSDWGERPLSEDQLKYARLDAVYVAQIYGRLLQLQQLIEPDTEEENILSLIKRHQEIFQQWKILDTEIEHLRNRIRKVMVVRDIEKTNGFKIVHQSRTTSEVDINSLAEAIIRAETPVSLSLKLTNDMKKALGKILDTLPIQNNKEIIDTLRFNPHEEEEDEEDIPF